MLNSLFGNTISKIMDLILTSKKDIGIQYVIDEEKYKFQVKALYAANFIALFVFLISVPISINYGLKFVAPQILTIFIILSIITAIIIFFCLYYYNKRVKKNRKSDKEFYYVFFANILFITVLNYYGTLMLFPYGGEIISLAYSTCFISICLLLNNFHRFIYIIFTFILFSLFFFVKGNFESPFFYDYIITAVVSLMLFYYFGGMLNKIWEMGIIDKVKLEQNNEYLYNMNYTLSEITNNQNFTINLLNEIFEINLNHKAENYSPIQVSEVLKNIASELKTNRIELEKSRQAEKQFLANMSHEIRTPLNAILGMSHLLYDTKIDASQKDLIDAINHSSLFLYNLISDILDIVKLEAGKTVPLEKEFDLVGQLKSLYKIYDLKLQAQNIEFELFLDPNIEKNYIGDEVLLMQLFHNLIGNAEKFTKEGTIGLKVKKINDDFEKTTLKFEIYDTGIGIAEENLELIFQKFSQVRNEDDAKTKGTGLGLSICNEILKTLGSKLEVKSILGVGTTFTFEIVLKKSQSNEKLQNAVNELAVVQDQNMMTSFNEKEFLIVEDNLMNRKYISTLFNNKGLKYDIAVDGEEAIKKCLEKKYDIILMDIQMPKKDGVEATIMIRNVENPSKNAIIIALTASALQSQKDLAINAGMNDFMTKPFTPKILFETLERNVNNLFTNQEDEFPFDENEIDTQSNNDIEMKKIIIESFWSDEIQSEIDQLYEWTKTNEQPNEIKDLLHKLKPSFSMVGFKKLYFTLDLCYKEMNENKDLDKNILLVKESLELYFKNKESLKEKMLKTIED
jgi:signal transduction histidine kinase/CheY-like chemotaxis protein